MYYIRSLFDSGPEDLVRTYYIEAFLPYENI